MASNNLHATLDELIVVLGGELPRTSHKRIPPVSKDTKMEYLDGWQAGWDACQQEVMKILNEGRFGQ